jgi:Family of unknown function (DUF6328)
VCLVLAIVLLISPAAIHRVTFGGNDDPRLHSIGSVLIATALFPMAVGLSCDLWVGLTRLLGDGRLVLAGAAAGLVLLLSMWYVVPLVMRRKLRGRNVRYATG